METRTLPFTDLTISRACFGTMTFGSQTDEPTAARIVDLCIERGVNFFDTANVYNSGRAETMVGNLLRGRRDRVILASKVRMKMGDAPGEAGLSRSAMLKNIDDSLKRLRTDYLDLYYLHSPDYSVRSRRPWRQWTSWCGPAKYAIRQYPTMQPGKYAGCCGYARKAVTSGP